MKPKNRKFYLKVGDKVTVVRTSRSNNVTFVQRTGAHVTFDLYRVKAIYINDKKVYEAST